MCFRNLLGLERGHKATMYLCNIVLYYTLIIMRYTWLHMQCSWTFILSHDPQGYEHSRVTSWLLMEGIGLLCTSITLYGF